MDNENTLAGFEETMRQLENTLEKMSAEDVTLEESIALYAGAADLIAKSDEALKNAQLRIEEIDARLAEAAPDSEE